MTDTELSNLKRAIPSKALALALMGIGLLILGGLALVLLMRSTTAIPEEALDYPPAIPVPLDFQSSELRLADIDGNPVSLADYAGQVVLLNNWAFWCPPCRAELPELQEYYEAHRDQGFTIVGIEAGGELDDVLYHVKLYKLDYPIWLDPQSKSLTAFKNGNLPNSYVIDESGRVRLGWNGPINREMLEEYVTPLLEEQ
jgi:thiol-disulfide isomerase/thioredoxin